MFLVIGYKSKSDDLRTNAFSTSTKFYESRKIYFGFVGHYILSLIPSEVLIFLAIGQYIAR